MSTPSDVRRNGSCKFTYQPLSKTHAACAAPTGQSCSTPGARHGRSTGSCSYGSAAPRVAGTAPPGGIQSASRSPSSSRTVTANQTRSDVAPPDVADDEVPGAKVSATERECRLRPTMAEPEVFAVPSASAEPSPRRASP